MFQKRNPIRTLPSLLSWNAPKLRTLPHPWKTFILLPTLIYSISIYKPHKTKTMNISDTSSRQHFLKLETHSFSFVYEKKLLGKFQIALLENFIPVFYARLGIPPSLNLVWDEDYFEKIFLSNYWIAECMKAADSARATRGAVVRDVG